MKNTFVLSLLLVASLVSTAQVPFSHTEGESAIVYSLPKTELCVEVELEKTIQKPGQFYRYSERYLATNKVILEEKTTFRLKNVTLTTHAIPDTDRTYSFSPSENGQENHLTVNAQGILCGVNISAPAKTIFPHTAIKRTELTSTQALLPLGEEYMMAGSEAKLAEGAAKQIYRIRERRLSLLTADVEKMPADGVSFKSMMDGMNKTERDLTELFIGKTTTESITQKIQLTPTSALTNFVLFRLSALKGVVASDDLSGNPYYINITPTVVPTTAANPKAKKEKTALYSIFPAPTQISINDGVNTLLSEQYFIPQFGKTIPIGEGILKQARIKISIDQQTGRILSIEQ